MWPDTPIIRLFRTAVPIVQAPMAGETDRPALTAAVSEAGGLGSIGGAYLQPDALRQRIHAVRALTARPFAVNLFVPSEDPPDSPERIARGAALLAPWRARYGIAGDHQPALGMPDFAGQMAVVLEEKPVAFSFTFGRLPPQYTEALKAAGIAIVGTATTVAEAEMLQRDRVDAIVAQGAEAGGHRGSFLAPAEHSLIGLMALVPSIVDRVKLPVIAAGGLMNGRGIAAALMLGATGVQLGTAFLVTPESGAPEAWKTAILRTGDDATSVTRVYSGRHARGIRNAMMRELEKNVADLPSFPAMNGLTREIRAAAAKAGDADGLSLWSGQTAALARTMPAAELLRVLSLETSQRLDEGFQG
jgi:nitronate monooxygenase